MRRRSRLRCTLPSPLPPWFEALILQCLEKSPELRPASAHELGRQLRAIAVDVPWHEDQAEAWWAEYLDGSGKAVAGEPLPV